VITLDRPTPAQTSLFIGGLGIPVSFNATWDDEFQGAFLGPGVPTHCIVAPHYYDSAGQHLAASMINTICKIEGWLMIYTEHDHKNYGVPLDHVYVDMVFNRSGIFKEEYGSASVITFSFRHEHVKALD